MATSARVLGFGTPRLFGTRKCGPLTGKGNLGRGLRVAWLGAPALGGYEYVSGGAVGTGPGMGSCPVQGNPNRLPAWPLFSLCGGAPPLDHEA